MSHAHLMIILLGFLVQLRPLAGAQGRAHMPIPQVLKNELEFVSIPVNEEPGHRHASIGNGISAVKRSAKPLSFE